MNNISIKAEPLFHIAGFPITNSILFGAIGFIFLVCWLLFVVSKVKKTEEKYRRMSAGDYSEDVAEENSRNGFFTRIALWCFEGLYKTVTDSIPNKKVAKQVAPFTISLFFIIGIQYYTGILPFAGSAFTLGGVPLFRSQAADLNFTFTLAIITIVAVQVWAFRVLGLRGNLGRYFINPFKDPIGCFAGFLELIGEFSRLIALAMRLFGNVFAGEVLLIVVTFLGNFASPIILPFFYIFELFIGGIQAYVFFMLATVFVGLAVSHNTHEHQPDVEYSTSEIESFPSYHSDNDKSPSEIKLNN